MASRPNDGSSATGDNGEVVSRGANATSNRGTGSVAEMARYRFHRTRQLMRVERKLVRSCEHVVLLNDKIRGLTKRYQQARAENFKSFRYNLRIRLAAVEGVRNMFYEYARDRAEEVAELRKELYDQDVQIITSYDQDEPGDEDELSDDDHLEGDSEEDMDADDEDSD